VKEMRLVVDAVNVVLRELATMPDSRDARKLRETAGAYIDEAYHWSERAPSAEEREALMKKVLALHMKMSRLARRGA
jgi:hypothetical protein